MIVTLNISDHLIEAMKKREGMSASRILKQAAKLLDEVTDEELVDDCVVTSAELLEIEPLVNDLYSQLRSFAIHGK